MEIQKRDKKGRFLALDKPRKFLKRLTKDEKELIERIRKQKGDK